MKVDEFRTGLDHFAFSVESRAVLEDWERELSARGREFRTRRVLRPCVLRTEQWSFQTRRFLEDQ